MTDNVGTDTELDHLDPPPETRKLSSGLVVRYEPLRTMQLFALLRILTRGSGPLISNFKLDANSSREEFMAQFLMLVLLAVPEADQEAIEFLRTLTKPEGLMERKDLNKQDKERNAELWAQYDAAMANPDLNDTLDIIEDVVRRESEDIQSLGKRIVTMFEMARRTGQLPDSLNVTSPETTPETSSED